MRYDGSGGVMGHDGMQMVVQGEMALASHFKCIMYIQFEVDVQSQWESYSFIET